mgnify:CR=1 FL=1
MKKGKLNSKGFVLVETLIVSVFIAAIFAILYNNFYPLMGEYEKREVYDDIDGKYATYWIKRIIQQKNKWEIYVSERKKIKIMHNHLKMFVKMK